MAISGKAFEDHFKKGWKKSFPNGDIIRIYDMTAGYKNIDNVSDFIRYTFMGLTVLIFAKLFI